MLPCASMSMASDAGTFGNPGIVIMSRQHGRYLFGVAPMTLAAVTTVFLFSQIYYATTGRVTARRVALATAGP
jgi:hypothetical protein